MKKLIPLTLVAIMTAGTVGCNCINSLLCWTGLPTAPCESCHQAHYGGPVLTTPAGPPAELVLPPTTVPSQ